MHSAPQPAPSFALVCSRPTCCRANCGRMASRSRSRICPSGRSSFCSAIPTKCSAGTSSARPSGRKGCSSTSTTASAAPSTACGTLWAIPPTTPSSSRRGAPRLPLDRSDPYTRAPPPVQPGPVIGQVRRLRRILRCQIALPARPGWRWSLVFPAAALLLAVWAFWPGHHAAQRGEPKRRSFRPLPNSLSNLPRHPVNPEAEQFYLKGRFYWEKRTPDGLNKAVDYFTQAIVHDPNYAPAYVGLADCYNLMREYTIMPASEAYPRALAAAQKAVELDDQSSEAHASWPLPCSMAPGTRRSRARIPSRHRTESQQCCRAPLVCHISLHRRSPFRVGAGNRAGTEPSIPRRSRFSPTKETCCGRQAARRRNRALETVGSHANPISFLPTAT